MKHIFEPLRLHSMELKSRLVRSATWEGIASPDGSLSKEAYAIYEELARGGIGAIITGFTSVGNAYRALANIIPICINVHLRSSIVFYGAKLASGATNTPSAL